LYFLNNLRIKSAYRGLK